ncbi:MAG: response regulator [Magnetospirillum sp.]|uniref:Regulatory protein VirG n=1 Tax=Paramagnetospirillum magnetotacticum MS-1 TaxID=272627 RepID=A0A0C2V1W1_PARME|nr:MULTISPECIES: response regulator [Rhodospirillales]KIL99071.1 Phosphate regulon transcriptional regulatory protein PhoB (SphR) [Paramagnetospirillum magnetotacticum MS-1]MBI3446686.1 response regulator [Magnetospirillum sp.]
MTHVLIVDDDPEICALLTQFLTGQGYTVATAGDGDTMRQALVNEAADLVILDLMLPGEDGLSLCRHLRATTSLPIIMLTAMGSETDRVVGLEMGADDYLAKPFSTRELLARIRAVLRRAGQMMQSAPREPTPADEPVEILEFSGWHLDVSRRRLTSPDGVLAEITSGEFDLLLAFLRHPHQVLSRDQLLDLARGRVSGPFDRTIDVQVGRLRRKMETDPKTPELFKTVRGGGYVLTVDVKYS